MLKALVVLASLSFAACAASPCQRSAQVDLPRKASGCAGVEAGPLLGEAAQCPATLAACSSADQPLLTHALDCLDRTPACAESTRAAFLASRDGCLAPLSGLTTPCAEAFFGAGLGDGGASSAGLAPLEDGGAGVELYGVADEGQYALAWTAQPGGAVARWEVHGGDGGPFRLEASLSSADARAWLSGSAGAEPRDFLVAALDGDGGLAQGKPDSGGAAPDAGWRCVEAVACPPTQVCDLGACAVQRCQPGGALTCPAGFVCYPDGTCNRQFSVGPFDAGLTDAGPPEGPRLLLSPRVTLATGAPGFRPDVPLGRFPAHRAAVAALDTARLFAAAEQEGLLIGHASARRGRDLGGDEATAVLRDTVGSDVHLTWNQESGGLFACYTVGRGVRVQRSADDGRTWGREVVTLEPPPDAGLAARLSDCELAPWSDGGALLVTVDGDGLAVRSVSAGLAVSAPQWAFRSTGPDGGAPFAPRHPALATRPAAGEVHLTFTASRVLGPTDSEPYVVSRSPATGGAFTAAQSLADLGVGGGSGLPQDWTRVAIEPATGRALAVFVTLEPGPLGSAAVADLYPVLFEPGTQSWSTRTDLGAFAVDPRDDNTTLLLPAKQKNERWNAFSPQLATLADGRLFLSFVAGPLSAVGGDYRLYAARFDFERPSPTGTGRGAFVSPAQPVSLGRVFDPRPTLGALPPRLSGLAADGQLSLFSVASEGVGPQGELEGRALTNVRP